MRQVVLKDILTMAEAAQGQIDRIFLHWSAGHYHQFFDDYHINIDSDGSLHVSNDLTERKAHTWKQNTGSVAVALACCAFATPDDLGEEPPTTEQVEAIAQVVAMLCYGLQLPVDSLHVRTHAEQADIDEYGPGQTWERWDLWVMPGMENGAAGDIIRGKAIYYLDQWRNDGTLDN